MDLARIEFLIVDDNTPMRTLLKSYLAANGALRLREAKNGREGLTMLTSRPADLVLLDHSMPGMTGIEFARALRQHEDIEVARTPLVMISGHGDMKVVSEARDAGINDFLIKPVTMADLLRRVAASINTGRSFIRSDAFVGPDRRRRDRKPPNGQNRRSLSFDLD